MTIKIHPSPTADTRTCDWSKVTRETLLASSEQHIRDIGAGLGFFAGLLQAAALRHDHDKITGIDRFHADFRTGFKQTGWWDNHRKVNRHHLAEADGTPADVNLIDVLDFITDCTMAGLARSGSVRPLALDPAVLQRAFDNTAALLLANVEVVPAPASPSPSSAPDPVDCGCPCETHPEGECSCGCDCRDADWLRGRVEALEAMLCEVDAAFDADRRARTALRARAEAAERERDDHRRAEATAWQQREEIAAELAAALRERDEAREALRDARRVLANLTNAAGCVVGLRYEPALLGEAINLLDGSWEKADELLAGARGAGSGGEGT